MYVIGYSEGVAGDLKKLKAYDQQRILDKIDEQLVHDPDQETRNKKPLVGLKPPWEHEGPVWELRVGNWRVFYDVATEEATVTVRAIRRKPPHQGTEEIL